MSHRLVPEKRFKKTHGVWQQIPILPGSAGSSADTRTTKTIVIRPCPPGPTAWIPGTTVESLSTQTTFSTRITPSGVVLTHQPPIVQANVPSLPDISPQDIQDILPASLPEDDNMSDYSDLQNLEIVTSIGNLRHCL